MNRKTKTCKCAVEKPAPKKPAARPGRKPGPKKIDVTFTLHAEKGKSVYLAGCFNNWDATAKKMAFRKGIYSTKLKLAAGDYQYKFVVDGCWCADPENANAVPNDQGTFNSVITVR